MGKILGNKERIQKAFRNEPVDRVPVGFWFHFLTGGNDMNGALKEPELRRKNYEGHKNYITKFKPDFVKVMSDGYFSYPVGAGERYDSPADLKKITVIGANEPWVAEQVALAKDVLALQEDTSYFYNSFSPISNLLYIIGKESFAKILKQDPDAVADALHTIADGLLVLAKALIEAGIDGIYFSVSNPAPDVVTSELYRKIVAPAENYFLQKAKELGGSQILHICGYNGKKNDLSLYVDYDADAINWAVNVENVSLSAGKKLFGGKAVIGGFANPGGSLIQTGAKEAIQDFTQKLLADAGKVGVVVGADCTVPSDTDLSHLEWVREAAAAAL
ncbi:MAG: hypothetical protein LBU58_07820 [Clostridiales bacterium]|nr:hypothetical protein [Clostridiales bacterium]